MRILITLLIALCTLCNVCAQSAQTQAFGTVVTRARIVDGDTIPHVVLPEVLSFARYKWKTRRAMYRYTRLVRNVKKVLPLARIAKERLAIVQDSAAHISDKRLRKAYIDSVEKELFAEFEKPLRRLTITQGRILIKLIDRETGDTSYDLIKTIKGRFSAFLWQGVARIFGSNLKSNYEAEGTDREIENIIMLIDRGVYDNY